MKGQTFHGHLIHVTGVELICISRKKNLPQAPTPATNLLLPCSPPCTSPSWSPTLKALVSRIFYKAFACNHPCSQLWKTGPFSRLISNSIVIHLTEQPSTTSPPRYLSLPPPGDSCVLCCQCFGGVAREPDSSKFTFLDFVWKRSFVSFWGVPEKSEMFSG